MLAMFCEIESAISVGVFNVVGRTTEGFYDTALNEAGESELRSDSTKKASACCQSANVRRKPLRKTHVARRATILASIKRFSKI